MTKILVVGSLHYDIMISAPHRPETGETVIAQHCDFKFGGKGGNQAIAVAKSGVLCRFFGAIGNDANGQFLIDTLEKKNVDIQFIETIAGISSGMSVAITDEDNDYSAVVIPNANSQVNVERLYESEVWSGVKLLLLQNELSEHINLIAAQEAKKRGVKVCLNAAPATTFSESFKEHIDLLVVNSIEARDMSGIEVTDLVTAEAAAKSLNAIYPIVIVTAGEHGVAFSKDLNCLGAIPSEKVELISTHGAGDCFMGTLCAKLVSGNDLIEAINKANKMAAVHVSTSPC